MSPLTHKAFWKQCCGAKGYCLDRKRYAIFDVIELSDDAHLHGEIRVFISGHHYTVLHVGWRQQLYMQRKHVEK